MDSGLEAFRTGGMQERGIQKRRNVGQEGCRKMTDAGQEGYRTGRMKGRRDEMMKGRSNEEKEGFRSGKIQDWMDT